MDEPPPRDIEDRVNELAEQVASQRSVSELVKLLVYFWAAISAVLGVFGWSKFADIDKSIEAQVQLQLPRDKQEFAKYQELVLEAEELNGKYKSLARDYEESVSALRYANQVGVDFDIEGKLTALVIESTKRARVSTEKAIEEALSLDGTILEPKWRKEAIATISIFKDSLGKKSYPGDFIFNVTQVCRRLDQFQLAEELTKAAYEKDPSPPVRALYLSSRVKNNSGAEREKSFNQLMEMVRTLGPNSPEIVLAESWNAAEDQRRYDDFIAAIDKRASSKVTPPSYLHVIRAQAVLRRSAPGAVPEARRNLDSASRLLAQESAASSWYRSSVREHLELSDQIEESIAVTKLLGATTFSGL